MATDTRPITARELALVALAVLAIVAVVRRDIDPGQTLDGNYDPDTSVTFAAFEQRPALSEIVGWYTGDGPNQVHTYRPLQYTMLRLEYALFGPVVWPYQVVSLALLVGCAAGVGFLLRAGGLSPTTAAVGGIATLAWPTEANQVVVEWICTRSEVLCGLCSVWAAVVLLGFLDDGGRSRLAGVGGLLLLAYLSKEMALGVALALMAIALTAPAPWRRRLAAMAAVGAVSVLWLVLFKYAESRMVVPLDQVPPGHTFEDLWRRLGVSHYQWLQNWASTVCPPLGDLVRIVRAGALVDSLSGEVFWRALAALILWAFALRCAVRHQRRWLVLWLCWNTLCYLPVMPLHDRYPWYLFIPDLLDRGLLVVLAVAVWDWAVANHRADLRLRGWAARQRRRWPVLLRWQWRRGRRWWAGRSSRQRELLLWAGLLVATLPHLAALPMYEPLTRITDVDGLMKLRGIAADPSVRAMLGYFVGDDPQGVHTFRPFPAATLWLEWHLWGFLRWPYQLSNLVWLLLTAGALRGLARRLDQPEWVAWLAAAWLLATPTMASKAVTGSVATRHDLTCALFGILALSALLDWLRAGSRRRLAAWFGWSLLTYLSKEMAVLLVPLGVGVGVIEGCRERRWGRVAGAAAVTLACAAVFVFWYRLAESNMGDFGHPSHSFGGMLAKLTDQPILLLQNTLWHLCRPLGDLFRQIRAAWPDPLWSTMFWEAVGRLVLYGYGFLTLCRYRRRALEIVFCWKICCYAPVLPLHDIWPWYSYMPHLLDYLLPPLFCDAFAQTRRGRAWLASGRAWLRARLTHT